MRPPTTLALIRDAGLVCNLRCSSCGECNPYEIPLGPGTYFLCSWCDVEAEYRWKR